jgi:hypothetical protein
MPDRDKRCTSTHRAPEPGRAAQHNVSEPLLAWCETTPGVLQKLAAVLRRMCSQVLTQREGTLCCKPGLTCCEQTDLLYQWTWANACGPKAAAAAAGVGVVVVVAAGVSPPEGHLQELSALGGCTTRACTRQQGSAWVGQTGRRICLPPQTHGGMGELCLLIRSRPMPLALPVDQIQTWPAGCVPAGALVPALAAVLRAQT